MTCQVDLTKSPPTEDSADPVEVTGAAPHLLVLLKVESNHFFELFYVFIIFS